MNSEVHILNPVLSPVGFMNLQNKQGIQEKVNLATKIGVHSQILRHKSSSEGQILSRQASELLGKCLFEGQMLLPHA